jgi:chromosome partitioning protein
VVQSTEHGESGSIQTALIAVVSGKGGVGKTTLALGLPASMARRGQQAALVDLDPQAGATLAAGLARPSDPLNAGPAWLHGFALYPASRTLALASPNIIARRVQELLGRDQVVFADLSPALTDAAHAAVLPLASLVLVVARTDAAGLANVAESVQLCREQHRPFLVVPSMVGRTKLAGEAQALLRELYAPFVATTCIPLEARAAEAAAACQPVTLFAPKSAAARAVDRIAGEVLDALGGRVCHR